MDSKQFSQFMGKFQELIGSLKTEAGPAATTATAAATSIPLPPPLELEGDMEENFDFFEGSWNTYISAVGMDKWPATQNQQKASILLSVVGKDALKRYFNFELSAAQRGDATQVLAAIKAKVVRERNKFVDWFNFFSLIQEETECIDNYLCRLKSIAKLCKFGMLEEELIKYKLVTSIKWSNLRSKLITTQNLTEAYALDLCRAVEIAERHSVNVTSQLCVEVNAVKSSKMKCKFCGAKHDFTKGACPALGKKCNRCGGKNHFEKVCKADRRKKLKKKHRVKNVREESGPDNTSSEESDSDGSEIVSIGKIVDKSGSGGNVYAELELHVAGKWRLAQCEIDTGANTSLVGLNWLEEMAGSDVVELLPSTYRLQGFGGSNIPVVGQAQISCRRKGRKYNLVLQVVDGPQGPLLSANVCRILGVVKFCNSVSFSPKIEHDVKYIHRVKAQDIVKQHENVFLGIDKLEPGSPVYVQRNPKTIKYWTPGVVSNRLNDRSNEVEANGTQHRRGLMNLKPRDEPQAPEAIPVQAVPIAASPVADRSQSRPVYARTLPRQESPSSEPDLNIPEVTTTLTTTKTPRALRKAYVPAEGEPMERTKRNV